MTTMIVLMREQTNRELRHVGTEAGVFSTAAVNRIIVRIIVANPLVEKMGWEES